MKKYVFANFEGEIIDPRITGLQWLDTFGSTTIKVFASLQTPDGSKFGVEIGVFTYGLTYEDADVMAWAVIELENYLLLP